MRLPTWLFFPSPWRILTYHNNELETGRQTTRFKMECTVPSLWESVPRSPITCLPFFQMNKSTHWQLKKTQASNILQHFQNMHYKFIKNVCFCQQWWDSSSIFLKTLSLLSIHISHIYSHLLQRLYLSVLSKCVKLIKHCIIM